MAILRDDEFQIAKTTGKPKITQAYVKPKVTTLPQSPNLGITKAGVKASKENVFSYDPVRYDVPPHTALKTNDASNTPSKDTSSSNSSRSSGSAKPAPDYSDYNAELLRQWNQRKGSFDTQASQLEESYRMNQKQLDESYQFALRQLQEQEAEEKGGASRLGQQAYISRMQAERVNPNILSAQGLANTGYKEVEKEKISTDYRSKYEDILYNYNQALNRIKTSKAGQQMDYSQRKASSELEFKQNKQSIDLARQQAYEDYLASLKK